MQFSRRNKYSRILGISLFAAMGLSPASMLAFNFGPATTIPVGSAPDGLAWGDWDGDGDIDLAVSVDAPDRAQILMNTGSGFGAPINVALPGGSGPGKMVAFDFDGDLDKDIAVCLHNSNQVLMLINTGGTFTLGASASVGANPVGIAAGDVNGDTRIDLVTANRDGNSASILTNTGGGFSVATVATGQEPRMPALGDLDGDNDLDLVVSAHRDRLINVFSNVGGTFSPSGSYSVGGNLRPEGVVIGKFDADADNDVAVSTSGNGLNFMSMFTNNGTGVLTGPFNYATNGQNPGRLAAADFDLDLDLDVAVANQDSANLSLMPNAGNATFGAPTLLATGSTPDEVIAPDIDKNGGADLAIANQSSNTVTVYMNLQGGGGQVNVAPSSFNIVFGSLLSGGVSELATSDNQRLSVLNGNTFLITQSPITVEFTGTSTIKIATKLDYTYEGMVSLSGLTQRLDLWNYTSSGWVQVDQRAGSVGSDQVVTVTRTADAGSFVNTSSGEVKSRLRVKDDTPAFLASWVASADVVGWTVTG